LDEGKIFNRFWYVYKCTFDGAMKLNKSEVSTGKFVDVGWLKEDIKENPSFYTDGLKYSFEAYLNSLESSRYEQKV